MVTMSDRAECKARHLTLVLGVLLLACACATPVGVTQGNRQSIYRDLTANVLSSDKLSAPTEQMLLRLGLDKRFEEDPEGVIKEIRGSGDSLTDDEYAALAELSFAYAQKSGKRDYYLAAAVYAYGFLAPPDTSQETSILDPRIRLSADIYNIGLTRGLAAPEGNEVILTAGERPLPFGTFDLETDSKEFDWAGFRMTKFIDVGDFEVRGLRNRYRQAGVGAPLAAELAPTGEGPEAEEKRKRIPPKIKVPVTAFVRIEKVDKGIETGNVKGRLELYPTDEASMVYLNGRRVPLEVEPTAALAYTLEGAQVWDTEIGNFLAPTRAVFGDGLIMMHPYRPGQIPVVLIHGTASKPARWAEMLQELQKDPLLTDRIQFWFFTSN